jgi:hypothetical protein
VKFLEEAWGMGHGAWGMGHGVEGKVASFRRQKIYSFFYTFENLPIY